MNRLKIIAADIESMREVERYPKCPELTSNEIEEVTRIVIIPSNPQQADLLFVFGSYHGDKWEQVADVFTSGLALIVYVAGGASPRSVATGRPLSHLIRDELIRYGVDPQNIITDEKGSINTLQDAYYARAVFNGYSIPHSRIIFACKPPHSGRCFRTLQKVFPRSELFPFTYDFEHNGIDMTSESWKKWWSDPELRSIVWGEYQRIKLYSARGDICS